MPSSPGALGVMLLPPDAHGAPWESEHLSARLILSAQCSFHPAVTTTDLPRNSLSLWPFPLLLEPQCLLTHPKHGWEKPGAVPGSEGPSVQQSQVPHSYHCNNTSFFTFFSQINPLHFRLASELLFFSVLLLRPLKNQDNEHTIFKSWCFTL